MKQPKRDARRKAAVQGAKVDKRSVTGSPAKSKSRNVTRKAATGRKPTASVGKLVEQAKKKETAVGKVKEAVEKIEKQVKKQEEEKEEKQRDGTPVRRSARIKVRQSLG